MILTNFLICIVKIRLKKKRNSLLINRNLVTASYYLSDRMWQVVDLEGTCEKLANAYREFHRLF